jgi:hypothetical protein
MAALGEIRITRDRPASRGQGEAFPSQFVGIRSMHRFFLFRTCILLVLLLVVAGLPVPARATPSFDNCTGFVALDANGTAGINAPGVWCLDHDLGGPMTGPSPIRIGIGADDVVLDCKGFRILGDPGNPDYPTAVQSLDHNRLTVRNCTIQGFYRGIFVGWIDQYATGLLVEDNVLDDNFFAMETQLEHSVIRRNRVRGAVPTDVPVSGIVAGPDSDIVDNHVEGVTNLGITLLWPNGGEVRGNTIRLRDNATGVTHAIRIRNPVQITGRERATIRDNVIVGALNSVGVSCDHPDGRYADNLFTGVTTVNEGCTDAGDNNTSP